MSKVIRDGENDALNGATRYSLPADGQMKKNWS